MRNSIFFSFHDSMRGSGFVFLFVVDVVVVVVVVGLVVFAAKTVRRVAKPRCSLNIIL